MFQILGTLIDEVIAKVYDGEPAGSITNKRGKKQGIVEEEVLLCKNNVCVQVQDGDSPHGSQHQPGYFTMKYVHRSTQIPDIVLCWVPNSLLSAGISDDDAGTDEVTSDTNTNLQSEEMEANPDMQKFGQPNSTADDVEMPNKQKVGGVGDQCDDNVERAKENASAGDSVDYTIAASLSVSTQCPGSPAVQLNTSPTKKVETFDTPFGDVFCINLQEMKVLKLFFTDQEYTCGHLVVGNNDNQYKVFRFHHNGLDKLSEIFDGWDGCETSNMDSSETLQKIFLVKRQKEVKSTGKTKKVDELDTFGEEGNYLPMSVSTWRSYLNPLGQIEDVNNFRKHVFFGGLSPEVRGDAWKFLLYCYPVQSTSFERDGQLKKEKEDEYKRLDSKRLGLSGEEYEKFWKKVQFTVDKDVVRTDRSNPFFSGQDNPNVQKMRNILLNYAIYNPGMGYTQGMSDLVAPLLAVIEDEVETFWSFIGLMEFSMFATTPTDNSMEKSLGFLKELLRLMYPDFYIHCLLQDEDLSLLFCHRWLVLCFRREFIEPETMTIWETCWSRYFTDYFHIFIAVALLCLYGKKCIERKMSLDKMLEYFSNLAMKYDGTMVLKKARHILFKFRRLAAIPCTLEGLLSGPGVWDGGIAPEIECISHNRRCCQDKKVVLENGSEKQSINAECGGSLSLDGNDVGAVTDSIEDGDAITDADRIADADESVDAGVITDADGDADAKKVDEEKNDKENEELEKGNSFENDEKKSENN